MDIKYRIGVLGHGKLAQFIIKKIYEDPVLAEEIEVSFIWNRSPVDDKDQIFGLKYSNSIEYCLDIKTDLVVELAHPDVSLKYAELFLERCSYFIGSAAVFVHKSWEAKILSKVKSSNNCLFLAKGALPGLNDILDLTKSSKIKKLSISMTKDRRSINFLGPTNKDTEANNLNKNYELLFKGSVRKLAQYAPQNVNTMVVAALASGLGLDEVEGELIAAVNLEYHEVHWGLEAKIKGEKELFTLEMTKRNPATIGAVSGKMTYYSFLDSILKAKNLSAKSFFIC